MEPASLLFASVLGFAHAFEADHLVAVSSIVTQRKSTALAMKDGIFWGLGHSSIILVVGFVFIFGRFILKDFDFKYLEGVVGVMLIALGLFRFSKIGKETHTHSHSHSLAYSIGVVHGLAGSGALLLSVLTQIKSNSTAMLYLLIFGMGTIVGMMVAAGLFSIPFSVKIIQKKWLRTSLSLFSAILCISLGAMIVYNNWLK